MVLSRENWLNYRHTIPNFTFDHVRPIDYCLCSQDLFLLTVPKVRTELEKGSFKYAAPSAWNQLQNDLNLQELVSLDTFEVILNDLAADTSGCRCFECFESFFDIL